MERSIVSKVDSNFGKKRQKTTYPYLLIEHNTDAIAVALGCLEEGDLPVAFNYNDNLIVTISVRRSPLNLNKILKLYPFKIYYSSVDFKEIRNVRELLEEERLWTL